MLAQLGQHDLTVALVRELIEQKQVTALTAARLLDAALIHGDSELQRDVIDILYDKADHFLVPEGFELPASILGGLTGATEFLRDWAPMVMANLMIARSRNAWLESPYALNTLVGALCNAWRFEPTEHIKRDTAAILRAVFIAFPDLPKLLESRAGRLVVADIREGTKSAAATSDAVNQMVARVTAWCAT